MSEPGYVLLEDGNRFDGELCGSPEAVTGEVVFNTAMTGYQEAVTDPSYAGQIITFTYPLIGNYGVSGDAMESARVQARAVIMRDAHNGEDVATAEGGWLDWLADCGIAAISGVERGRSCATSATPARCAAGSSPPTSTRTGPRARWPRSHRWTVPTSPAR